MAEKAMAGVAGKYLNEDGSMSEEYDEYNRKFNPNYQLYEGGDIVASVPSFEEWLAEQLGEPAEQALDETARRPRRPRAGAALLDQAEQAPAEQQSEPEQAPAEQPQQEQQN